MSNSGFFDFLRNASNGSSKASNAEASDAEASDASSASADEWSEINWDDGAPEGNEGGDEAHSRTAASADESAESTDVFAGRPELRACVEQDAVLSAALEAGIVTPDQVQRAMPHNAEEPDTPLWRTVAKVDGVNRTALFKQAATSQNFETITIDEQHPTDAFLQTLQGLLRDGAGGRLLERGLLPVEMTMDPETGNLQLVLATHDPSHPGHQELARSLQVPARLCYAAEAAVRQRLKDVRTEGPLSQSSSGDGTTATPEAPEGADTNSSSKHKFSAEGHSSDIDSPPTGSAPRSSTPSSETDADTEERAPVSRQAPWHSTEPAPSNAASGSGSNGSESWESLSEHAATETNGNALTQTQEPPRVEGLPHSAPSPTEHLTLDELVHRLPERLFSDLDVDLTETVSRARTDIVPELFDGLNGTNPAEVSSPETTRENGHQDAPAKGQSSISTPETTGADEAPDSEEEAEDAAPPTPPEKPVEQPSDEQIEALRSSDRVVDALLRKEIVTPVQVVQAQNRKEKKNLGDALWRVLAEESDVDRESVYGEAARVYAFPHADLETHVPDAEFTRSVMDKFSDKQRDQLLDLGVVPLRAQQEGNRGAVKLYLITYDPMRPEVHRITRQLELDRLELQYAPESAVSELIGEAFPKKNEYLERIEDRGDSVDLGQNYEDDNELIDEEELEAEINRSTLINLFEATLVEAVREGASDVHIYPNADKEVEIHFRIDGRLTHWHTEDKVHPEALLSVIKDNAMNVDRFERDAAQDGFIQRWVDNALIRFRVSVMPIANASQEIRSESIVIRVLDDRKVITNLNKLGLLEGALERFEHAINQPHGMVILTGPTGSGKSTTLVAALHRVITPEVNVLTIEDPVEYIIPGVRQIKLNDKLQLQDALRSILRHDPDVVMVGEMRDRQTAELAIKLANTGHLTFSTLHTNDAPSAVSRLYKMGIEPFLIAYAINLVVAQRLIRKLCPECKRVNEDPDPVMLQQLGFTQEEIQNNVFYTEGNDPNCNNCKGMGYRGRRAISEALSFSRPIRHMIVEADGMVDEGAIREQAQGEGMLTLRDSAREVVKMGETSVREMMRVVASEGKTLA